MKYYPDDFLKRLYKVRLRTTYAKITLLTFREQESVIGEKEIKEIQGTITTGSINVSSSSAIRRTVSLTMVVNESNAKIDNIENDISINKKFQLEVGLKNPFKNEIETYGDIIWFQQGVFVISSVNSNRNTNGWTLSITAKDKMCLLDGTAGGSFYAPTVLSDKYIYLPDGDVKIEYPILRQIIYEAVNHYGGEEPDNIFINDLDDSVRMLVKYDGYKPIYYIQGEGKEGTYSFEPISGSKQVNYGEDVGYKLTDFTYPEELILNPGETVVTLLDKIVTLLGNYEYFYDIDGHFIFQEIKNYVNTQSPLDDLTMDNLNDESYLPNFPASNYVRVYSTDRSIIQLTDLDAAAAITYNPKYDNIKNDFVVWGQRGENQPIHYHLTIDAKPAPYYTERWMIPDYDLDWNLSYDITKIKPGTYRGMYVKLNEGDSYLVGNEGTGGAQSKIIQQTGMYRITGVSQNNDFYFIKVEGEPQTARVQQEGADVTDVTNEILPPLDEYEWREELYREALYLQSTVGFGNEKNVYYEELIGFWRDLYDPNNSNWDATNHWNPDVYNNPGALIFWLDTIDTSADIGKYSISQIGRRTKAVNNDKIKTIYNKEVPDLLFVPPEEERTPAESKAIASGEYNYCQLPTSKWDLFSISSTGSSCFDEIRNLLYQHLNYNATISITCIPIYYLEPNNLIHIEDAKSGIIGNYQITQFSLPLTYNGTMNISATEVVQRI